MARRARIWTFVTCLLAVACGQIATPVADPPPPEAGTVAATATPHHPPSRDGGGVVEGSRGAVQPSPAGAAPAATPAPARPSKPEATVEFVIPRRVTLALGRVTVDGERTARLDFFVPGASNGCVHVGPLVHSKAYSRDRLLVRIEGYERSGEPPKDAVCTADVQHATASIDVDRAWLTEGDRTLVVTVGSHENRLELDHEGYYATLDPTSGSNVRVPERAVGLFPMDVGELYLAGNVDGTEDHREALREFAHDRGWEPADEVYEGIRQPHRDRLYVVVRDRKLPPPNRSVRAGRLSRGVHVYLSAINDTA